MVLAGAVLVCSGSLEEAPVPHPPSGYPMAFAEDECAPWDGAAVAIYLTDKHLEGYTAPYPHLRIAIWRPAAELGGQIIRWSSEDQSIGVAVRCPEAGKCQRARSVTLQFGSREPNGAIPGYLELEFEESASIRGGFRAEWRDRRVMCG